MKVFGKGNSFLLGTAMLVSYAAHAQSPENKTAVPAFRGAAIQSMIARIQKMHFSPKPVDDNFSAAVWSQYLYALDLNSYIFLQEDLDTLAAFKTRIDNQLLAGDPAFFELVQAIYVRRVAEAEVDYNALMAAPMEFDQKEIVKHIRKYEPFPADGTARKELWRKLLKYYLLRNYMDIAVAADSNALGEGINKEYEAKAVVKVKKFFGDFFNQAQTQKASEERFNQYMNVVAMEFDAHTMFSGPQDRTFNEMLSKRFFGLGIELESREGEYYIKRLMPGGPAYMSGLVKESDRIVAIADDKGGMTTVSGMPNNDVVNMIRGEKGTTVKMEVQQAGEQARTVVVKRDEIIDTENKAKSAVIEQNGKRFGYIRLNDFYIDPSGNSFEGAAADVNRQLARLKDEEVEAIILDLRGNGGGALDEVVKMCGSFIPEGTISWLRGKTHINRYSTNNKQAFYQGPLTVMVDESSASASEIFAAAMQDYRRALIVGTTTTYGKGSAQQSLNLGKIGDAEKGVKDVRYGSLRLTLEKFYRTSGKSTQLRGVGADIVLQSRMNLQSIMEKDFSAVLPYDSVDVEPFKPVAQTINFPLVIAKAQARIAANPVYAGVEAASRNLKMLMEQPALLDLEGFKQQHKQWYSNTRTIQQLRELPTGKELYVTLTTDRNINPAMRNDAEKNRYNKNWLDKISKDVYVAETISILEDMLANPLITTSVTKQ